MHFKPTTQTMLAGVLLFCGTASSALSLGPVSGTPMVGRPLELSAPLQFDDLAAGSGSGCVSAEVLYGERAVDSARIQLSLTRDATRQGSVAWISSATPVDEPVVTLLLRAGCGRHSASRRYVLLADAPRETAIALAASPTLAAPSALALDNASTGRARAGSGDRLNRGVASGGTPTTRTAGFGSVRESVGRPATVTRVAGAAAAPRGRLQLALWDPALDRAFGLRTSSEMRTVPAVDSAHRAAATALWRALNAQPQDLLRTSERLRGLEGELTSLRGVAARHRAEISSARESLQSAQSQRHIHLLLAAVLAILTGATAAFFWHRTRRSTVADADSSWYESGHAEEDLRVEERLAPAAFVAVPQPKASHAVPTPPVADVVVPLIVVPAAVPVASRAASPVWDPVVTRHRDVLPDAPMLSSLEFTLPDAPPATTEQPDQSVGLRVDSLHGVQQQAEFFGSLGQYDEAIAVLVEYIDAVRQKPVLAFLELLRIYHGIGNRVDYEELQSRFRLTFGADVAGFSEFRQETRELEAYPVAMMRICSSWATVEGQEIIEQLLFKRPPTPRDVMSLQAYRDLLWLYTLGHDIVHANRSSAGLQLRDDTGLPNNHFILPWAVGNEQGPHELSLESLRSIEVAPGLEAFGVDIDLTLAAGDAVQQVLRDDQTNPQGRPFAPSIQPVPPPVPPESFDEVMEGQSRR